MTIEAAAREYRQTATRLYNFVQLHTKAQGVAEIATALAHVAHEQRAADASASADMRERASKLWADYETDIIGQPFELVDAIAALATTAKSEGHAEGRAAQRRVDADKFYAFYLTLFRHETGFEGGQR